MTILERSRAALVLCAVACLLTVAAPAFGQIVDPQLAVGNGLGGSCPTGQCPIGTGSVSGEVNAVGSNLVDIYLTDSSKTYTASKGPLLLIVGMPGTASDPAPPSITIYSDAAHTMPDGTGQLGPAAPVWGGNWGNWDSTGAGAGNPWTGSKNAPDQLNLPAGGDSSQNYGNWTAIDGQIGVPIGSSQGFDLWVYELNLAQNINGKSGIDVVFSGSGLPAGTLIYANGCVGFSKCQGDNLFFTPFTVAGDVTTVTPEPAAMALMGTFLLAASLALRRKLAA